MKAIVSALLLITSLGGQAAILDTYNKGDILNEILASLEKFPLNCTVKGSTSTVNARTLNIRAALGSDYNLEVKEGEQPVILINSQPVRNTTAIIEVFTDDQYKKVVVLNAKRIRQFPPRSERVNVGTIIHPVYKDVLIEVPSEVEEDISCR